MNFFQIILCVLISLGFGFFSSEASSEFTVVFAYISTIFAAAAIAGVVFKVAKVIK